MIYHLQSPSGKSYVGKTTQELETRWRRHISRAKNGSVSAIHNAIRKYGPSQFSLQVLSTAKNEQELNNLERVWIILLRSNICGIGYNMTSGGEHAIFSDEVRAKMSAAQKGVPKAPISDEHRTNLSKALMGVIRSEEFKKRCSLRNRGVRCRFARLTEENVRAIRKEYIPEKVTQQFLADKYGVSPGAIWGVIHRHSWSHL